jgi:hypothetical protein
MKTITIPTQIKNNLIAIISLIIAITALSYNTWRNEHTERNRNIRTAAFEVLKELGELQVVINYSHYQRDGVVGNPYLGWGYIAYINDLSQLLPSPIPNKVKTLTEVWRGNWSDIKSNETAIDKISKEIDNSRESVLEIIRQLK